jgi:hypothetical protein
MPAEATKFILAKNNNVRIQEGEKAGLVMPFDKNEPVKYRRRANPSKGLNQLATGF